MASKIEGYSVILGLPWLEKEKAVLDAERQTLSFKDSSLTVRNQKEMQVPNYRRVGAAAFYLLT